MTLLLLKPWFDGLSLLQPHQQQPLVFCCRSWNGAWVHRLPSPGSTFTCRWRTWRRRTSCSCPDTPRLPSHTSQRCVLIHLHTNVDWSTATTTPVFVVGKSNYHSFTHVQPELILGSGAVVFILIHNESKYGIKTLEGLKVWPPAGPGVRSPLFNLECSSWVPLSPPSCSTCACLTYDAWSFPTACSLPRPCFTSRLWSWWKMCQVKPAPLGAATRGVVVSWPPVCVVCVCVQLWRGWSWRSVWGGWFPLPWRSVRSADPPWKRSRESRQTTCTTSRRTRPTWRGWWAPLLFARVASRGRGALTRLLWQDKAYSYRDVDLEQRGNCPVPSGILTPPLSSEKSEEPVCVDSATLRIRPRMCPVSPQRPESSAALTDEAKLA